MFARLRTPVLAIELNNLRYRMRVCLIGRSDRSHPRPNTGSHRTRKLIDKATSRRCEIGAALEHEVPVCFGRAWASFFYGCLLVVHRDSPSFSKCEIVAIGSEEGVGPLFRAQRRDSEAAPGRPKRSRRCQSPERESPCRSLDEVTISRLVRSD